MRRTVMSDVGPLTPGRIIDLNERAMRYFDPRLQFGVIYGVSVRPLFRRLLGRTSREGRE